MQSMMASKGARYLRPIPAAIKTAVTSGQRRTVTSAAIGVRSGSSWVKNLRLALGVGLVGGVGTVWYALEHAVSGRDLECHPQALPWTHAGMFESIDIKSARRGYQVYKQVCAACHSLKFRVFRHMCDSRWPIMSEEECRVEAAEVQVDDIDDNGKPKKRTGKITDRFPEPYANKKEAAAANNGALPPDLSLIVLGRHGFEDYIFSLLVSYMDPPAGVAVGEGQAYNPYFLNGVLSMSQQLFDEGVEYYDGTPATISQQAKDVSTFLRWTAEPFHDSRKRAGLLLLLSFPFFVVPLLYMKRFHRSFWHNSRFAWQRPRGREPPSTPQVPQQH